MSATKGCFMSIEEQCGLQLVCDYPNSGYEEPIPDEQPVDYVVDTKTADLYFGE